MLTHLSSRLTLEIHLSVILDPCRSCVRNQCPRHSLQRASVMFLNSSYGTLRQDDIKGKKSTATTTTSAIAVVELMAVSRPFSACLFSHCHGHGGGRVTDHRSLTNGLTLVLIIARLQGGR